MQTTTRWTAVGSMRRAAMTLGVFLGVPVALAQLPMTMEDFHVPGTQIGDVTPDVIFASAACAVCHGDYDEQNEPFATWAGSLMGQAGRDPLFFAQMTTANQDVANVGYYCMRCHVPMSIVSGHADNPSGGSLSAYDRDGVSCHLCHSMIDPIQRADQPPVDQLTLSQLEQIPGFYGNAMFVLDNAGRRRGPYLDATPPHYALESSFMRSSNMCGTCHDVGNVCVTRQNDGSYRYNELDAASPTSDPHGQFPLERTYTEWLLSAFANGGVDMGGRFGGNGPTVVSSCQDCHMPRTTAQGCFFGPTRDDLARHDFSGSADWVLEIIGIYYANDPAVDQVQLAAGRQRAVSMLQRAATVEITQFGGVIRTRVYNETGHKLPTGHIEGRRAWVNVKFFGAGGELLREFGHYDAETAELDETSTDIYEMVIGLSEFASQVTGLPPGPTTHMSLADIIVKDNRIPPRGFDISNYEAAGAPAVGADYADGQYWDDNYYRVPVGAARVEATAYYQIVTRHYIEALREGNHTDHWGETLHNLWAQTDRAAPTAMHAAALALAPFVRGDVNCDGYLNNFDIDPFVMALADPDAYRATYSNCDLASADINGDGAVNNFDIDAFVECLGAGCQ
ncbi:MAG: hypothetical protein JNG88_02695 [Phycisphaerales bacterium]|nr:hypothetical protein [Phycisphaerales bacterium]